MSISLHSQRLQAQSVLAAIALVATGASLAQACREAGVSHNTVERRRKSDPAIQALYIDAVRACRQVLRLRLLMLMDAPLAAGRPARSARNRQLRVLHDALAATYNSGAANGGRRPRM